MHTTIGIAPRGLVTRSLIAAVVFAATVLPGWALGDLVERWTGWGLLDWLVTGVWSALAVYVLAPHASYRRRDAVVGLVPILGWYLTCVLSWRVALLPYRDWEPRADELWRARWLTGDLVGLWRADPLPAPVLRRRPDRDPPDRDRPDRDRLQHDRPQHDRPDRDRPSRNAASAPDRHGAQQRAPMDGDTVPLDRQGS